MTLLTLCCPCFSTQITFHTGAGEHISDSNTQQSASKSTETWPTMRNGTLLLVAKNVLHSRIFFACFATERKRQRENARKKQKSKVENAHERYKKKSGRAKDQGKRIQSQSRGQERIRYSNVKIIQRHSVTICIRCLFNRARRTALAPTEHRKNVNEATKCTYYWNSTNVGDTVNFG